MKSSTRIRILLAALGLLALLIAIAIPSLSGIGRDEEVAFYGSYLYWSGDGDLRLVLRGRMYEPEPESAARRAAIDRVISPALFRMMGKKRNEFDHESLERMVDRLAPFLVDGESRVAVKVRLRGQGGEANLRLHRTDAGGYFSHTSALAGSAKISQLAGTGAELAVEVVLPLKDPRQFAIHLAVPPRQLALLVASDVDDTIRIGEVNNRQALIERTYLRPYEPVPGMPEVYNELSRRGAWIHYVSASPWQLYPTVHEFLDSAGFPSGVLHGRHIGWDIWNDDSLDLFKYKVTAIEKLLDQFKSSKILLIGDSGQKDPEVYSRICRGHPDRVAGIWIRRVDESWEPDRLAEATELLGESRVVAFDRAEELRSFVEQVVAEVPTAQNLVPR